MVITHTTTVSKRTVVRIHLAGYVLRITLVLDLGCGLVGVMSTWWILHFCTRCRV